MTEFTIDHFVVGQRIAMGAWSDRFMRGDVYGEVVGVGRKYLKIKFDRSGQTETVSPSRVGSIVSNPGETK